MIAISMLQCTTSYQIHLTIVTLRPQVNTNYLITDWSDFICHTMSQILHV